MDNPIKIAGRVIHGRALGRHLGFPTANISLPDDFSEPFGVYFARAIVQDLTYWALVSIGVRPTIDQNQRPNAECYILDFEGNIYGENIFIELLQYIRSEQRFNSIDKLREQILRDTHYARQLSINLTTNLQNTMNKSIKGTKTEKNLLASFAGESQARMRYNYFASQARKEGYEVIAKFFDETAENEKQHAKQFFKLLEGGMVEITASYPAGVIGTTAANLLEAANGEHEEGHTLYPEAAKIADEEGFPEIAHKFRQIAAIEKKHEGRYRALLETVEAKTVFKKADEQVWRCRECGHEHIGPNALEVCPVCQHPQAFQEIKCDKY